MILLYLIIFVISFDGIITTNISTNRLIIIASCQIDKTGLESIPIPSGRSYYFYFSSPSSSSLSSSSSFLPLLHLSYCEHQQTTSYSSSGFSILYSSPHFPLTDDKKHSSSFHDHNATLDQLLSSSSNITTTLMSSPNENNNHLISTTTLFSNLSLLNTSLSTIEKGNQIFNMLLLIGCIIIGIILMLLIYMISKCCNRNEGTYKIDESNHFITKSHSNNHCTAKISSLTHHHQKLLTTNEQKLDDSKEWYV